MFDQCSRHKGTVTRRVSLCVSVSAFRRVLANVSSALLMGPCAVIRHSRRGEARDRRTIAREQRIWQLQGLWPDPGVTVSATSKRPYPERGVADPRTRTPPT